MMSINKLPKFHWGFLIQIPSNKNLFYTTFEVCNSHKHSLLFNIYFSSKFFRSQISNELQCTCLSQAQWWVTCVCRENESLNKTQTISAWNHEWKCNTQIYLWKTLWISQSDPAILKIQKHPWRFRIHLTLLIFPDYTHISEVISLASLFKCKTIHWCICSSTKGQESGGRKEHWATILDQSTTIGNLSTWNGERT